MSDNEVIKVITAALTANRLPPIHTHNPPLSSYHTLGLQWWLKQEKNRPFPNAGLVEDIEEELVARHIKSLVDLVVSTYEQNPKFLRFLDELDKPEELAMCSEKCISLEATIDDLRGELCNTIADVRERDAALEAAQLKIEELKHENEKLHLENIDLDDRSETLMLVLDHTQSKLADVQDMRLAREEAADEKMSLLEQRAEHERNALEQALDAKETTIVEQMRVLLEIEANEVSYKSRIAVLEAENAQQAALTIQLQSTLQFIREQDAHFKELRKVADNLRDEMLERATRASVQPKVIHIESQTNQYERQHRYEKIQSSDFGMIRNALLRVPLSDPVAPVSTGSRADRWNDDSKFCQPINRRLNPFLVSSFDPISSSSPRHARHELQISLHNAETELPYAFSTKILAGSPVILPADLLFDRQPAPLSSTLSPMSLSPSDTVPSLLQPPRPMSMKYLDMGLYECPQNATKSPLHAYKDEAVQPLDPMGSLELRCRIAPALTNLSQGIRYSSPIPPPPRPSTFSLDLSPVSSIAQHRRSCSLGTQVTSPGIYDDSSTLLSSKMDPLISKSPKWAVLMASPVFGPESDRCWSPSLSDMSNFSLGLSSMSPLPSWDHGIGG